MTRRTSTLPALLALALGLTFVSGAPTRAADEDPFAAGVRPTPWRGAAEERALFQLPPGLVIQLVASEPDIQKPMNLAFDERGRLWLTDTIEYPYAAPADRPARDTIKILEDADGDGRAEKITTFADGLNLPIGVCPYKGGAIAWSIPYIWHLKDNDGDGKCDERVKLYGPMGFERDTHGMNNAFRWGLDGWIYACHGFNNETVLKGADGNEVRMQSGNTYRIRPDGSRAEHFTWGQVNPFGMCFDARGNLFTADCHTRPITALLRGGYYESFGKPNDGLGFVPEVMQHLHGSTANCGIVVYEAGQLPGALEGCAFTGNVMTSRVNTDRLIYSGTTPRAVEEQDLVATGDPWFRPVDLQEAPDGTLYIADFYNRIIGHYEVPLTHPGRDRTSGRIWRVVSTGSGASRPAQLRPGDLRAKSIDELVELLGHRVLTTRMLATHELVNRGGASVTSAATAALAESKSTLVRAHCLWVLEGLGALPEEALCAAVDDADALVRIHALKIVADRPAWSVALRGRCVARLRDSDAFVERAAAEALAEKPRPEHIRPLLDALQSALQDAPAADGHLVYAVRRALRNQLRKEDVFAAGLGEIQEARDVDAVLSVVLSIESRQAAAFLLGHLDRAARDNETARRSLEHAARLVDAGEVDVLVRFAREKFEDDPEFQLSLMKSIRDGLEQRGAKPPAALAEWGSALVGKLLDSALAAFSSWRSLPLEGRPSSASPWVVQSRASADGNPKALFLCSLPRGEQLTGILRSKTFPAPERLSFFIAGHAGFPDKPPHRLNAVRLRDAGTDAVLRDAPPPRNDTAQRVDWDLGSLAGRSAYLEVIDGDDGNAYAWLAAGRFDPAVVELPAFDPGVAADRTRAAADVAAKLGLRDLRPRLEDVLVAEATEPSAREAIAAALLSMQPSPALAPLVPVTGDASASPDLRLRAARAIAGRPSTTDRELLEEVMRTAPARLQALVSLALASSPEGAATLLRFVADGRASPRLLQSRTLRERLASAGIDKLGERIEELTKGLGADADARDRLISARRKDYEAAGSGRSAERGAAVFEKNCGACHQIAGKGKVLGPQLDGVGNRGLERVLEDVLDPNRNVDVAFRTTTLVLKDGNVFSGLLRRKEGKSIVFADSKGEEVSFSESDVQEESKGDLSLMPENISEVISSAELNDLIAFLLASRGKPQ